MTRPGTPARAGQLSPLCQTLLDEASKDGQTVMETLVAATRRVLRNHEDSARTGLERQGLVDARQYLNKYETVLAQRYVLALQNAFAPGAGSGSRLGMVALEFDKLELMDESLVSDSVELARAQQVVAHSVEVSLAEFVPLISAAAGFASVRPEHNPLRPEVYIRALQAVVKQMQLPAPVRAAWMWHMGDALGLILSDLYRRLAARLREQGVQAAGYAVRPTGGGFDQGARAQPERRGTAVKVDRRAASAAPVAATYLSPQTVLNEPAAQTPVPRQRVSAKAAAAPRDESLLTLDKLRRLLAGELEPSPTREALASFSARFSRAFDSSAKDSEGADSEPALSDFHITVPAAFETLQEMKQVEQAMQRIGSRKAAKAAEPPGGSASQLRGELRRSAKGLGQSLSLEVVTLMVDNIASDARLLVPVQNAIRALEPALLRLAMTDPRFFSNRRHPARRLLDEITHRSLAWESPQESGFADFLRTLSHATEPLAGCKIEDEGPFQRALDAFTQSMGDAARQRQQQIEAAVASLRLAEQRNLLAQRLAGELARRDDLARLPDNIVEFLRGPWTQVMAQARVTDQTGAADPGGYGELIDALVWSAQPALTGRNVSRLTRLVPKLLGKLREGLELIQYPAVRTSAFFESLMNLHQLAFRPAIKVSSASATQAVPAAAALDKLRQEIQREHWMVPAEARVSGFIELDDASPAVPTEPAAIEAIDSIDAPAGDDPILQPVAIAVGSWVELLVKGRWVRTQLTWASPHGTLFLFTSGFGTSQSMTARLRDKMLTTGTMRLVSGQHVVDGALDAVAQTAMQNSVDIKP